MNLCALCFIVTRILITPEGECLRIETEYASLPCTEEIMQSTGCWDENNETQLCGASWIEVRQ